MLLTKKLQCLLLNVAPVTNPIIGDTSVNADYGLASANQAGMGMRIPGANPATVPAAQVAQPAPYEVPGMFDSVKKMGSGIMDIGKGNFEKGFKDLTGGAGDLFMPSGPTDADIRKSAELTLLTSILECPRTKCV
jgi:hypothetical protein